MAQEIWLSKWQSLSTNEYTINVSDCKVKSMDEVRTKFKENNIYLIAERVIQNILWVYISVCIPENQFFFGEIRFELNFRSYVLSTRSESQHFITAVSNAIQVILNN
jgi:hypothetical protein